VSRDETIKMCARGILYHDNVFASPLHVDMTPIQEFVQTGWTHPRRDGGPDRRYSHNPPIGHWKTAGYSVRVNGLSFRYARDPSAIVAELARWSDIFFNVIEPAANDFLQRESTGELPNPEMSRLTACPFCGCTLLFRAGRIAEVVSSNPI
jgi:hypothetical protein